jgi:predicted phosphodiesterase
MEVTMKLMQNIILLICSLAILNANSAWAMSSAMERDVKKLAAIETPFTFAIIGDNRSGDRVYKKVVRAMMNRKPLFVMNTGDIIPHPGNRDQWQHFRDLSTDIDVPYFLAPGNHDIDDEKSLAVWKDVVDLPGREDYYSFTVGQSLFVVLNSCEPGHDRKIEGHQLAWLKRILGLKKYEHKFVFLHHPLFLWSGATHKGKSLDMYPKLRDNLHKLFVRSGVSVVFMGHEHTYNRRQVGGVEYIVTGGAGAPLYGGFNHFAIVKVDGPLIFMKVIDRKGFMRDEYFIKGP